MKNKNKCLAVLVALITAHHVLHALLQQYAQLYVLPVAQYVASIHVYAAKDAFLSPADAVFYAVLSLAVALK